MHDLINIQDIVIVPFWLIISYLVANRIQNKHIKEKPYYKYFKWGLFAKIFAGLAFAAIYLLYYGGGDTVYYFHGTQCIGNMLWKDLPTFLKILIGNHSQEIGSMFDRQTGYPYYFRDPNSFSVCRFNILFYFLGFQSYLGNSIIQNLVLFIFVWQFFKMVVEKMPQNEKWLALAILFIPSVTFWSSGILKDSWTLTSIFASFVHINNLFLHKHKMAKNILGLVIWSYIAFSIRPYIFYVTIGSGVIWVGLHRLKLIKSNFLRLIAFPLMIIGIWLLGVVLITQTSNLASKRYSSIDNMLETAQIIQSDLTRSEAYGKNNFDIGDFEATIPGIIKKFPKAVMAGIYRPYIWEANNLLMMMSGIEGTILLLISIYLLFKNRVLGFIKPVLSNPFITSITILMITYAFFVGLSSANFGAMVRYRIPVLPFLAIILIHVYATIKPADPLHASREDYQK